MKAKRYEVKDRNFWTDGDWKNYLDQNFKTLKARVKFAKKEKQPIPTGICSLCKINLYGKNTRPRVSSKLYGKDKVRLVSFCDMKNCPTGS
jgi:hypothetical protein